MSSSRTLAIIPARYKSSRFPGKMLHPIQGKPLIQHTYENALNFSCLDKIVVATDDMRIKELISSLGGTVVMTSKECPSGTDRLTEVLSKHPEYSSYDVILNIQGDEPCVDEAVCSALLKSLKDDADASLATPILPFPSYDDPKDPSIVKCVSDIHGNALYFSRSPIPFTSKVNSTYYKHLGIYAFKTTFLLKLPTLTSTPLQIMEDLEQLKILEHGHRIKTVVVQNDCIGINEPKDVTKVESLLCKRNLSSSQGAFALH